MVKPQLPKVRTGKKVAVVGSGPSGLAAAHAAEPDADTTLPYMRETTDRADFSRYGIPNMKLEKASHRPTRLHIMEAGGYYSLLLNANVGKRCKSGRAAEDNMTRVVLACGASNPRDIKAPGRDAKGIYFAVDFLNTYDKEPSGFEFRQIR